MGYVVCCNLCTVTDLFITLVIVVIIIIIININNSIAITLITMETREAPEKPNFYSHLTQRLSVAIQVGNCVSVLGPSHVIHSP